MQKHIPLIVVALTIVVLAIAYLIYDSRARCDSLFAQTATRLGGKLAAGKTSIEFAMGRDGVQKVADDNQKVALHLESCCLAQQLRHMSAGRYQSCVNGAKEYERRIIQIVDASREAKAAQDQGNPQLASETAAQVRDAATKAGADREEPG